MADLLDADEVSTAIAGLDGWTGDTRAIRRDVTAPNFMAGIRLVDEVAAAAEDLNHHPDIDIRWTTVTFSCASHSAGGVTGSDIALAKRIDEAARRL